MTHILHLDSSARPGRSGTNPHGSHTRRLTHAFVSRWRQARPNDSVTYRDIGAAPPAFIDHQWIQAAFASADQQQPWMAGALAQSEVLVDELLAADILVIGAPLYNFGMPAALKAWFDNVVRIGRTVDFDPTNLDDPYIPRLSDRPRRAVVLSARGGHGFEPGGELEHLNHLEPNVTTILGFIGITEVHSIAIEHQEEGGEALAASIAAAERRLQQLVDTLLAKLAPAAELRRA